MKLYSWNVNGIRAAIKKGYWDWFKQADADVVCIQETKARPEQIPQEQREAEGYSSFWNSSKVKKGYSGTACFSRILPVNSSTGLPKGAFGGEGRLILLEYEQFYLFNIYFPNGKMSQERLEFKLGYYDAFLDYAQKLRQNKPIIVCGDFNTAHTEIDLKNPKSNVKESGFLPIERAWLDKLIALGYIDTFRMFTPDPHHYSWWSYRFNARSNNSGWRIDYFFVSSELKSKIKRAWIEPQVMGSDHCPVGLELNLA